MLPFLIVALVAAVVTACCSHFVLKIAHKHKIYADVRMRDVHTKPTPRLGGIAMYIGFLASFAIGFFVPGLRGEIANDSWVFALLLAATAIAIVGILDDIYDLDWMVKLAAQLVGGGVLAWQGVQILSLPFGNTLIVASPTVNLILTVLLIVAVMNAVNFIDGMDGLAAGFALIGSAFFFVYTRILTDVVGTSSAVQLAGLISAVLFGVCVGFIPFNWHKAKMFMGDTGALLIGLLLATSTIAVTGQLNPGALDQKLVLASFIPIILPLALLALPFADMLLAILRRLRAGKSPFAPDRKHLHHRLLDLGHSHTQVVLIFYIWTITLATFCLLVFILQSYAVPLLVFAAGSVLCLLVTLMPAKTLKDHLRRRGLWISS